MKLIDRNRQIIFNSSKEDLYEAILEAKENNIDISNINIYTSCNECPFSEKNLRGFNFKTALFKNVHFFECDLRDCDFSNAKFVDCIFDGCNIENSDFSNALFDCNGIESVDDLIKLLDNNN